ncbi:hypothetical protein OHA25_08705 [Nonomuraea sp. NBC_00507]|uniref:hypothetical protein n=1 Tax=Nonomuraea sp. NBC_00507 TaxID=2976002 RepID=UPI002E19637C
MQIRLIGTPTELRIAVRALRVLYTLQSVSPQIPARPKGAGLFRVYVEAVMPEPVTVPDSHDKTEGPPRR